MTTATRLSSRTLTEKKASSTVARVSKNKQAVLKVGGLPSEFSEKEVRAFFAQFGTIRKMRLSRSTRTARSRCFAFVQMELPEVAAIAAEATNNYFIGGKPISVVVMSPESVMPSTFKGCNKKFVDRRLAQGAEIRKSHNKFTHSSFDDSKLKKDEARKAKLASAGVEYEFTRRVVTRVSKKVSNE